MDNKQLIKKFHDKKFLKSNEFAVAASKLVVFFMEYKSLLIAALVVALLLALTLPVLHGYRLGQVKNFNKKFYQAQKSLKKESVYQELMTHYKNLPASQMARLYLIDELKDHDNKTEAHKVIAEGLDNKRDIFTTLLVLKGIDLLKEEEKYAEATREALARENNVMVTFLPRYRLIIADLYWLAGNQEEAKKIYANLVEQGSHVDGQAQGSVSAEVDPGVVEQAKDNLSALQVPEKTK